ncbi:hypothetical protein H4R27_001572 [Coemansia aciculifera]|nr:hypothetical protein H4R27_001572 [Coemansia aciculifera]
MNVAMLDAWSLDVLGRRAKPPLGALNSQHRGPGHGETPRFRTQTSSIFSLHMFKAHALSLAMLFTSSDRPAPVVRFTQRGKQGNHLICSARPWFCIVCGYKNEDEFKVYDHCRNFEHWYYDR